MESKPVVGIVMGSDSDLETMKKCAEQLGALGIACEMRIISAHRTPQAAHEYAASAAAGAEGHHRGRGMSAALSGVLASETTLPVIGVPMASGPLAGWTRSSARCKCRLEFRSDAWPSTGPSTRPSSPPNPCNRRPRLTRKLQQFKADQP